MFDMEKAKLALVNAHKAGDTDAAKAIAERMNREIAAAKQTAGSGVMAGLKSAANTLADSNEGIKQGLTLGFGDELMAGMMTPIEMAAQGIRGDDISMSKAYGTNLDRERGALKQAQERSPIATTVGNVAGGVMTAGGLSKGGLTLLNGARPTVASMAGRGAAEGAAYGAVQGFGSGEGFDDRLSKSGSGAVIGGVTGGAIGGAGAIHAKRAANKTVATIEKIRADKNAAYAAVDQSGHSYAPAEIDTLINSMGKRLAKERVNPMRHPKAASMMDDVATLRGRPQTLTELDQLRQVVSRDVAGATDPAEKRLGAIMINEIDNFINARPGNQLINTARGLNTRLSKAEKLGTAMTKAERRTASTGSGGNIENAARQNINRILDNPKQLRGFNKAEIDAMNQFVRGGKLQNFMRVIGKLSPSGNGLGLWASLFSGSAGLATGNPLLATAPLVGLASKAGAERAASNAFKNLDVLVRNGGVAPQPALSQGGKALLDMATREGALQNSNLVNSSR